jgi:excinuclease ABC subunit C
MEAPQKITTTDIEERDLFAAQVEGDRAAVQVFSVRDGRVVAREGFLLDRLTEPEAVLASTLQQFYAGGRYVPREVVVPEEIPDRQLLEAWLAARRGTLVRIHVPQRGEKLRLLELVVRNAAAFVWNGSTPGSSRWRSCGRCGTSWTSRSSLTASSASTSRTSRGPTSWLRWSCSRRGCRRSPTTASSGSRGCRARPTTSPPFARSWAGATSVSSRREKDLPDLVLIDGGKGQLGAAVSALEELGLGDQPVVSLAKREEILFVRGRDEPIALPRSSPVLQLVQRVRDEAHRFAIGFHRQVRSGRTIRSELDDVPGIGPAKRRKMLSVFGSVRGVRGATEAELAAVVGKVMAARLRAHLDGTGGR